MPEIMRGSVRVNRAGLRPWGGDRGSVRVSGKGEIGQHTQAKNCTELQQEREMKRMARFRKKR